MICRSCQVAGYVNVEANRRQFYSVSDADGIRALARSWHKRCDRKGCTCQHVLGQVTRENETSGERPAELDGKTPLVAGA